MGVLEAVGLYRFFHVGDEETIALRGVDLDVAAGELCALQGPSGSGKSTLIACLAGLDDPDGGAVTLMGERISRRPEGQRARIRARHVGLMTQGGNLFEHLSFRDNVQLALALALAAGRGDVHESADRALADLDIAALADALPATLSGGQYARAGLAVALAPAPPVLICDEPTAEVDTVSEARIIARLRTACRDGAGVLVATHSAAIAASADRVIHIKDGRIANG